MGFEFQEFGPLVDRELELIAPDARWVDDMLASAAHPLSRADAQAGTLTREKLIDFLRLAPAGRQPAQSERGLVPAYHFWMLLHARAADAGQPPTWGDGRPPLRIAGGIGLRVGHTRELERYYGHVGYNVFPAVRGNHYAERACRLLLRIARAHRMGTVWITCNPDNLASRRTCERLGCVLVDIVPVPPGHPLHARGEHEKCRYRLDL